MLERDGPRDAELGTAVATRVTRELGRARGGGNESLGLEAVARSGPQPERAVGGAAVGDERDGNGKRADAVLERISGPERERLPRDLEYKPAVACHDPEHLAGG